MERENKNEQIPRHRERERGMNRCLGMEKENKDEQISRNAERK